MPIFCLFHVLYKLKLLSPVGLFRLLTAIYQYGINVMMLLKVAERMYGHKVALVDDQETITYHELLSQAEQLSTMLKQAYELASGKKVGILCKNHASLIKAIFAASYTGADIFLLNTEMSGEQLKQIVEAHDFDLLVHDVELTVLIGQATYEKATLLSYHDQLPAINRLDATFIPKQLTRTYSSKINLLTGGTTGRAKKVAHKPSLFNYLPPFLALLNRLQLQRYQTAYLATPIYHGYGIAFLLLFIALGKKIVITSGFDAKKACDLIKKHRAEVVTVVPLMLHKMMKHDADSLRSLDCIASGSAELSPKLVADVYSKLGAVLYNLYGTSEAGLNIIATPEDLHYSAKTLGRKIKGTHLHVLNDQKNRCSVGEIGEFCVKNKWSMHNQSRSWIETGDLGYRDEQGYYFLYGRVDDMVVSAGENVYPVELEQVLIQHPFVEDVAVFGVPDEMFGQRLKAVVQLIHHAALTEAELRDWLRPQVARYQMPKEIVFVDQISYTHLGKRDKKQLRNFPASENPYTPM